MTRSFTTTQARNEYEDNGPRSPPSTTVFVANVPWSATEEDLGELFSEFGKVISVRIRGFFFLTVFFSTVFFLWTTLLDLNNDGRPRGIAHIEYADKECAVAAIESAAQEPLHMLGRDLRIDFSAGGRAKPNIEPNEKLYFSGCAGTEEEIRDIFKQFEDSIIDIHLCMLFALSDSVSTTHME